MKKIVGKMRSCKVRALSCREVTVMLNVFTLMIVASKRGNTMLERYHWGAYGSKTTGQWSCCNENRKDAPGCQSADATSTRKDSVVSQSSTKSDDTLISDLNSPTSSITPYSSDSSKSFS